MKRNNKIDLLIENLSSEFSKITNFNLLHESEEGRKLFDFVVKSISDLENFQTLYLNYYLPAANKSIVNTWNDILGSKYKAILNLEKDDLKENLYETIRFGYVGLFHKYESFLKSLILSSDFLFKELREENNLLNIEQYCKEHLKINIYKTHDKFHITKKINYISNSIKHYDSFPKQPVIIELSHLNPDEKIKLEKEEFKKDIEALKFHCQYLTSVILAIGFKQYLDLDYNVIQKSLKIELKDDLNTKLKLEDCKKTFEYLIIDLK